MKGYSVYGSLEGGVPLFVINTFHGDGSSEWAEIQKLSDKKLTLVVVLGVYWDADMTPYPCEPVYSNDHYLGRGEEHLRYLKEKVLPTVTKSLANPPSFYGIAGYSLAGLFACSTLFWDTPFSRVASASGSLWYPGFLDFAKKKEGSLSSKVVFLSLGNKESQTKNATVAQVGEKTQAFLALLKEKGAEASFEWNEGNHFVHCDARMARAIVKLL
jgi:predicted alpha/beta superfamily hydrolase